MERRPGPGERAGQRQITDRDRANAQLDALAPRSIEVREEPTGRNFEVDHVEDVIIDFRPISDGLRDHEWAAVADSELPCVCLHRIQGWIRTQLEREGAGIVGVGTADLENHRRAEPTPVAGEPTEAGWPQVVHSRRTCELFELALAALGGIQKIGERQVDVVVAERAVDREPGSQRPPQLAEGAQIILLCPHLLRLHPEDVDRREVFVWQLEDFDVDVVPHVLCADRGHQVLAASVAELNRRPSGLDVCQP